MNQYEYVFTNGKKQTKTKNLGTQTQYPWKDWVLNQNKGWIKMHTLYMYTF